TLDNRASSLAQLAKDGEALGAAVKDLSALFAAAREAAADRKAPAAERAQAVRLLGRGLDNHQEDAAVLAAPLVPQTPDEVQAAGDARGGAGGGRRGAGPAAGRSGAGAAAARLEGVRAWPADAGAGSAVAPRRVAARGPGRRRE